MVRTLDTDPISINPFTGMTAEQESTVAEEERVVRFEVLQRLAIEAEVLQIYADINRLDGLLRSGKRAEIEEYGGRDELLRRIADKKRESAAKIWALTGGIEALDAGEPPRQVHLEFIHEKNRLRSAYGGPDEDAIAARDARREEIKAILASPEQGE